MTRSRDDQPDTVALARAARAERDLAELLGLAKGMLSDGVVNDDEARYLRDWGTAHPEALDRWPINLIFSRLHQHFADGRIDETERVELRTLLENLVGGTASVLVGPEGATTLPLDDPRPPVGWGPDVPYVFTGRFAYGTLKDCEHEAAERGSPSARTVSRRTAFLVIGTFGSRDWQHTTFGAKIRRAVQLRDSGAALRIIGEDHWVQAVRTIDEPPF